MPPVIFPSALTNTPLSFCLPPQRFLTWIPLGFIFQTNLIHTLLDNFFPVPAFRSSAIQCLTEIATLTDLEPQYDTLFQSLYMKFLARLGEVRRASIPLLNAIIAA